jgi:hypothetical protein
MNLVAVFRLLLRFNTRVCLQTLKGYLVAGAKLNPLCTFRAEGDWSLIQNSLSGVLDLYYAIALMSLPSKCRMS